MIPILENHDPEKRIGSAKVVGETLVIEFIPGHEITPAQFFEIFGDVAVMITDQFFGVGGRIGESKIRAAIVRSWSLGRVKSR